MITPRRLLCVGTQVNLPHGETDTNHAHFQCFAIGSACYYEHVGALGRGRVQAHSLVESNLCFGVIVIAGWAGGTN